MAGLMIVRFFVLYHDHQHGAILKGSKLADFVMLAFGLATLNPPSVWKRSHDHHHGNNCKGFGANIGSYPLVTVEAYENALLLATISLCGRAPSADDFAGILHDVFLRDVRGAARGQPEATSRRGSLDRLPCGTAAVAGDRQPRKHVARRNHSVRDQFGGRSLPVFCPA